MTIKGDKGEAKDIVLATKADTFEAGSRDKFEEVLAYLGKISSITVWHDATSNKPTWYLQSVILQVEEFAEFKAGSTFVPEKYCFYFKCAPAAPNLPQILCTHSLCTQILCTHPCPPPLTNGCGFAAAVVHPVILELAALGSRQRCSGSEVASSADQDKLNANCTGCSDWLKKKEGDTDHPSTGLLLPQDEDMSSALIEACCEVVTSGLKGAGTDSEVRIRLHGRIDAAGGQRSSSWVPLTASHDTFERGRTDLFDKLQVEDVGQMASLEVRISAHISR